MSKVSPDGLTPGLEQQLQRLELIGNAEAHLTLEEDRAIANSRGGNARIFSPTTEARHRLDTTRRKYEREAKRSKQLALALLLLSPLLLVSGMLIKSGGNFALGLVLYLLGGIFIGFALPALYYANQRIQQLEE